MAISTSIVKSFQLTALSTALALALAGCGGGGGNDTLMPKTTGSSSSSQQPASTPADTQSSVDNTANISSVRIVPSQSPFTIASNTQFEVSIYALDANNNGVANVPVKISLSDPLLTGVYSNVSQNLTTDETGKVTVTFDIKALTNEQRAYLKDNGIEIKAAVGAKQQINIIKGADVANTPVQANIKEIALVSANNLNTIETLAGSRAELTTIALNDNYGGIANAQLNVSLPDPTKTGIYNISGSTITTNENGEASIVLEVKSDLSPQQINTLKNGINIVVSAANDPNKTQTLTIKAQTENPSQASISRLTASVDNIPLTNGSRFTITAVATDNNNAGVANVPVSFMLPPSQVYGVVNLSPNTIKTDAQGQASITLEVGNLTDAQRQRLTDEFKVTASVYGNSQDLILSAQRISTVADVKSIALISDTNSLTGDANQTITFTAVPKDTNGKALANLPVNFDIGDSKTTGITATSAHSNVMTDANGEAKLQLAVGDLTAQQLYYLQTQGLQVTAQVGDIKNRTDLKAPSLAKTVLVSSDYNAVKLALGNKVKVTAIVLDSNNAVLANTPVMFKLPADSGIVNNTGAVVMTNENGRAEVELDVRSVEQAEKYLNREEGLIVEATAGSTAGHTSLKSTNANASTDAYDFFVTKSKDALRTGADKMTLGVRVTDTKGGIKPNVPVYLELMDQGTKYGLSFNTSSQLVTDNTGYVEFDLVQSDIGLISQLDHTAKINIIINDGLTKPKMQALEIPVRGTTVKNIVSSKTSVTQADTVSINGVLVDGVGKPIPNTQVELLNAAHSLTTPYIVMTDDNGRFTMETRAQQFGTAIDGKYPLSIRAMGFATDNQPIQSQSIPLTTLTEISPSSLRLTMYRNLESVNNNEIRVGDSANITVDVPSDVPEGTDVYLSTTRGSFNNGSNRAVAKVNNRRAVFYGINSVSPGLSRLIVEYNGKAQFETNMSFITTKAEKLILQLTNSALTVNGETKVIALVKDANDAPVKNAIVEFTILKDPSAGTLSTAYALTDDAGVATISYFAGSTPTPNEGVTIRANVKQISIDGKLEDNVRQLTELKTLTVQSRATYIGFAFSDRLRNEGDRNIYYLHDGSVFVNNNVGQPAANQEISISFVPVSYRLGQYYVIPAKSEVKDQDGNVISPEQKLAWGFHYYLPTGTSVQDRPECANEDRNLNGILDTDEDINKNGKLDPLNPVTILSADGTKVIDNQAIRTDELGKLDFSIRYPKEVADWLTGVLKVTTRVDGSEYVEYRTIELSALADDVELSETEPQRPNWRSPFGTGAIFSGSYQMIDGKKYCR